MDIERNDLSGIIKVQKIYDKMYCGTTGKFQIIKNEETKMFYINILDYFNLKDENNIKDLNNVINNDKNWIVSNSK